MSLVIVFPGCRFEPPTRPPWCLLLYFQVACSSPLHHHHVVGYCISRLPVRAPPYSSIMSLVIVFPGCLLEPPTPPSWSYLLYFQVTGSSPLHVHHVIGYCVYRLPVRAPYTFIMSLVIVFTGYRFEPPTRPSWCW